MVIRGEEGRLDQPLDMDLLIPECFQGLLILSEDDSQGSCGLRWRSSCR